MIISMNVDGSSVEGPSVGVKPVGEDGKNLQAVVDAASSQINESTKKQFLMNRASPNMSQDEWGKKWDLAFSKGSVKTESHPTVGSSSGEPKQNEVAEDVETLESKRPAREVLEETRTQAGINGGDIEDKKPLTREEFLKGEFLRQFGEKGTIDRQRPTEETNPVTTSTGEVKAEAQTTVVPDVSAPVTPGPKTETMPIDPVAPTPVVPEAPVPAASSGQNTGEPATPNGEPAVGDPNQAPSESKTPVHPVQEEGGFMPNPGFTPDPEFNKPLKLEGTETELKETLILPPRYAKVREGEYYVRLALNGKDLGFDLRKVKGFGDLYTIDDLFKDGDNTPEYIDIPQGVVAKYFLFGKDGLLQDVNIVGGENVKINLKDMREIKDRYPNVRLLSLMTGKRAEIYTNSANNPNKKEVLLHTWGYGNKNDSKEWMSTQDIREWMSMEDHDKYLKDLKEDNRPPLIDLIENSLPSESETELTNPNVSEVGQSDQEAKVAYQDIDTAVKKFGAATRDWKDSMEGKNKAGEAGVEAPEVDKQKNQTAVISDQVTETVVPEAPATESTPEPEQPTPSPARQPQIPDQAPRERIRFDSDQGLPETESSTAVGAEDVVKLEGKRNLVEEINEKLQQQSEPDITFGVSPDLLREYIASVAQGKVQGGTIELNPDNKINIKGVQVSLPIGGTITLDLAIENDADGIKANVERYKGGFIANRFRGQVEERIKSINSAIKENLDKQIAVDNPSWKTQKVSISEGTVLVKFGKVPVIVA